MPGLSDRANDKRYQAYRSFTPGIENISDEDAYRNYATYYSEGASADTGAKTKEFEQFYKATGGGGRAALPDEGAEAAPAAPSGGGAGADMGSIGSMALGGFQQAQAQDPVAGATALPMPNAANPLLGQRIYPMAMRQLSMAGRFY